MNTEKPEILEPQQLDYDIDNSEDKKMYDEMIDEVTECCSLCKQYGAARILEELDPTAYRCGFNDYIDDLPKRWQCPICDKVHDDEDSAKWCCQEEPEDEENE